MITSGNLLKAEWRAQNRHLLFQMSRKIEGNCLCLGFEVLVVESKIGAEMLIAVIDNEFIISRFYLISDSISCFQTMQRNVLLLPVVVDNNTIFSSSLKFSGRSIGQIFYFNFKTN